SPKARAISRVPTLSGLSRMKARSSALEGREGGCLDCLVKCTIRRVERTQKCNGPTHAPPAFDCMARYDGPQRALLGRADLARGLAGGLLRLGRSLCLRAFGPRLWGRFGGRYLGRSLCSRCRPLALLTALPLAPAGRDAGIE